MDILMLYHLHLSQSRRWHQKRRNQDCSWLTDSSGLTWINGNDTVQDELYPNILRLAMILRYCFNIIAIFIAANLFHIHFSLLTICRIVLSISYTSKCYLAALYAMHREISVPITNFDFTFYGLVTCKSQLLAFLVFSRKYFRFLPLGFISLT
jgi:hypothetical protein